MSFKTKRTLFFESSHLYLTYNIMIILWKAEVGDGNPFFKQEGLGLFRTVCGQLQFRRSSNP